MFRGFGTNDNPLNELISSHNDLVKKFNELGRQMGSVCQKSEIEAMKEVNDAQYDASARYVSVIIVAGYAAFFTMWGSVKENLPRPCILWSGLLMIISIILFVGFEVIKMIFTAISHQRILRAAQEAHRSPTPSVIKDVVNQQSRQFLRLWKFVLVPTVVTGFGSAGILVWAFISGLLDWYCGVTT